MKIILLTFRTENLYVINISANMPPEGPTIAFITYGRDTKKPVCKGRKKVYQVSSKEFAFVFDET